MRYNFNTNKVRIYLQRTSIFAIIVAVAATIAPPLPSPADALTTKPWKQSVEDIHGTTITSTPRGDVVSYGCTSAPVPATHKVFDFDGNEGGAIPNIDPKFYSCLETHAVGRDNAIYGTFPEGNRGSKLASYKDGELQWTHKFEDPNQSCSSSQLYTKYIFVGSNDVIYVGLNEASTSCQRKSYLGAIDKHGSEMFVKPLEANHITNMHVYKNGIVILNDFDNNRVRHFDLEGNLVHSFNMPAQTNELFGYKNTEVDTDGRLYVKVSKRIPSSGQCRTNIVISRVLIYTPEGAQQEWVDSDNNECQSFDKFVVGPWGAAFTITHLHNTAEIHGRLVTIDTQGSALYTKELPFNDNGRNYYDQRPTINIDTNGHLFYARQYYERRNNDHYLPEADIQLLDHQNGNVLYNFNTTALNNSADLGFTIADYALAEGQLYITGKECRNTFRCHQTYVDRELYAIPIEMLGMDYLRGSLLLTPPDPFAPDEKVYFFGDSFISGEGIKPFGPDQKDAVCHRSEQAWPVLATQDPKIKINWNQQRFLACSGATMTEMLEGTSENPWKQQVTENLDSSIKKAVVSIGGNDIEFSKLIITCLLYDCQNREQYTK